MIIADRLRVGIILRDITGSPSGCRTMLHRDATIIAADDSAQTASQARSAWLFFLAKLFFCKKRKNVELPENFAV